MTKINTESHGLIPAMVGDIVRYGSGEIIGAKVVVGKINTDTVTTPQGVHYSMRYCTLLHRPLQAGHWIQAFLRSPDDHEGSWTDFVQLGEGYAEKAADGVTRRHMQESWRDHSEWANKERASE